MSRPQEWETRPPFQVADMKRENKHLYAQVNSLQARVKVLEAEVLGGHDED